MASREFIEDLTTAMEDSRQSASEDLASDAVIQLTGLADQPKIREKLVALIGIDDMQASETDGYIKKIYKKIKDELEATLYDADDRKPYEKAMAFIRNAGAELEVYNMILPIHQSMLEQEERNRMEMEEALTRDLEEKLRQVQAAAAAEAQEQERIKNHDQRRRQAWLNRFTTTPSS
jgi:hypothetical protein